MFPTGPPLFYWAPPRSLSLQLTAIIHHEVFEYLGALAQMAFCPPVNRLGPGTGWVYNWNHDSAVIQPAVLSRRSGNTDHIFTDEHSWAQDIVALDPRFRRKPCLEAETIAKIPKRGIVRGIDKPLVLWPPPDRSMPARQIGESAERPKTPGN